MKTRDEKKVDWVWGKVMARYNELVESGHPECSQTMAYATDDCKAIIEWGNRNNAPLFADNEFTPKRYPS
jgi:hypothetical protein